jgi:hypothetical protein
LPLQGRHLDLESLNLLFLTGQLGLFIGQELAQTMQFQSRLARLN